VPGIGGHRRNDSIGFCHPTDAPPRLPSGVVRRRHLSSGVVPFPERIL
jgi:hypothetical protein